MEAIKRKVEQNRRSVDDIIMEISVKRMYAINQLRFEESERYDKALQFLSSCQNELFMCLVALGL